ncbi:S24 family peptidase [Bacillus sp. FSL K6-6483]
MRKYIHEVIDLYDRNTFARNLKFYMKEAGVNATQLAEHLNMAKSSISGYTNGTRQPDVEKLVAIAKLLGVSVSDLLGEDNKKNQPSDLPALVEIPILGTVRAGYNLLADENIIGYSYALKNEVGDGDYFYLLIEGNSMIEAGLTPGTKVLVRKQNFINDGSIAVVLVNGDEATVKRVFYDRDKVILSPENSRMKPTFHDEDEITILGKVVSFTATIE